MADPLTFLTVLAPALIDGVKSLINRFTGGAAAQPASIAEKIQLMDADTNRLEKLAVLESSIGASYPWVNAVRAMQRPVCIAIIMLVWAYAGVSETTEEAREYVSTLMSAVIFYLLGDRTYSHLKGK